MKYTYLESNATCFSSALWNFKCNQSDECEWAMEFPLIRFNVPIYGLYDLGKKHNASKVFPQNKLYWL